MWMCDRCQEINESDAPACAKCGLVRKAEVEDAASGVETAKPESAAVTSWLGAVGMWLAGGARGFAADARIWASGRVWIVRAALLAYLAYAGFRHMVDPDATDWFAGLTLGVHEAGHVLTRWAPFAFYVAAGSIAQVAAPIALALSFVKQRDYFAIAVAGCWLSFSLFGLSQYIGDARAMVLPLVTVGGGDALHDWNYLLGQWNMLPMDTAIAGCVRAAAIAALFASVAWGAWICAVMFATRRSSAMQLTQV
jgi:hypothetical protein